MASNKSWSIKDSLQSLFAFVFVLFLQGAIPFLMMPTLGQAIWSMGFSQSLSNGPLLDLYTHDFGIPKPAAIAFGLAGVWPASLFIRLGLHAADAYTVVATLYFGLAMSSAFQISRRFGATRSIALVGSVAWMSMPIICGHSDYSMLSWGIALLSFYFLAAFKLFLIESESKQIAPSSVVTYVAATIVSVFMDGYTFMMFATGASILLLYTFVSRPKIRPVLLKVALTVHVASFAIAYLLYSVYVGRSNFETHSIDFFRGWGLDISFIVIPTQGVSWLSDLIGLSLKRTDTLYFGDRSVWRTTFALPVFILGVVAWWKSRGNAKISTGVFLVVILGFYMSLGPSLKINSTKPESLQISHPHQQSALMASEFAVMPTGNGWISKTLPGFNVMRASYRWSALGIFALWLLTMIWVSRTHKENRGVWFLGLLVVILFNLPDFQKKWQEGSDSRVMAQQIDDELVIALQQQIKPGETVAFVPWKNDFMANYLAPAVGFRTYNIGGDKNLFAAQSGWPYGMLAINGELDKIKTPMVEKILVDEITDVVVLPYFNMMWSPQLWPCPDQTTAKLTARNSEHFRSASEFICPDQRRAELHSFILMLRESPYLDVSESELFATVRLRPEFLETLHRSESLSTIFRNINYPIILNQEFTKSHFVLPEGWYNMESDRVWSRTASKLILPVPKECETRVCHAVLKFSVFGANSQRPISVMFNSTEQGWQWAQTIMAKSEAVIEVSVPLTGAKGSRSISIAVPEATSPQALRDSLDSRVLGIALQRIELLKK